MARSSKKLVKIEKIGKVSDASVEKGSGKGWSHWIAVLDKAGGRVMTHREIVAFLKSRYKLTSWWQQGVASGYEIYIGRKVEGRNAKGEYSTTASRTIPLSSTELWDFIESPEGLAVWLKPLSDFEFRVGAQFEIAGGVYGEIRTLKKPERLRLRWQDEEWPKASVACVFLIARTKQKCVMVFQHDQLPSERARLEMNARWKAALADVVDFLK